MKICIPTANNQGLEATVFHHFGSAPFFTMVDTGTGQSKIVRNPACGDRPHMCHHIDILKAHGVQAVACSTLGRRAMTALREAGVDVLGPVQGDVAKVLETVERGEVSTMVDTSCGCGDGGGHHHSRRGGGQLQG